MFEKKKAEAAAATQRAEVASTKQLIDGFSAFAEVYLEFFKAGFEQLVKVIPEINKVRETRQRDQRQLTFMSHNVVIICLSMFLRLKYTVETWLIAWKRSPPPRPPPRPPLGDPLLW